MLKLFNSLGRKMEVFRPVNRRLVTLFTCGPSVYQPSHIGNFRTFLFEDVLVRYLEYAGYTVRRGMNFTDIEDKAIEEAARRRKTVGQIAGVNIRRFIAEMRSLRMKVPDYLPTASATVDEAASLVAELLRKGVAYRHGFHVYFDPLKFRGFGKLYGLDMRSWPVRKRRFHKDTYPGMRWNRGDFILWHGCDDPAVYCWQTEIGRGRPSWNVQDAGMVSRFLTETLSLYCGGIDNLIRHHDYSKAIIESVRPYPMARFWLHCNHLYVDGRKMSKSLGNIHYIGSLRRQGFRTGEIRFFLIYGHYRDRLIYSARNMAAAAGRLRDFRARIRQLQRKASPSSAAGRVATRLKDLFISHMDNDLDVRGAFDAVHAEIAATDIRRLSPQEAAGAIACLREIDEVLQVLF